MSRVIEKTGYVVGVKFAYNGTIKYLNEYHQLTEDKTEVEVWESRQVAEDEAGGFNCLSTGDEIIIRKVTAGELFREPFDPRKVPTVKATRPGSGRW